MTTEAKIKKILEGQIYNPHSDCINEVVQLVKSIIKSKNKEIKRLRKMAYEDDNPFKNIKQSMLINN